MPVNNAVTPPSSVLGAYGWSPAQVKITPAQPGFSGASVWQVQADSQCYALKRWPSGHPVFLPLPTIHDLMRQTTSAGLHFLPQVRHALRGASYLYEDGHQWDVTTWQPGVALSEPSDAQLSAAVRAVAQLHSIWRTSAQLRTDVCPAVQLQHQRLSAWTADERNTLQQLSSQCPHCQMAIDLFRQHREPALKKLEPWLNRKVPLHPCLADIWSDHVLFTDNAVTGIIDVGGMRYDHPAQDLARLLGSYTQGNARRRMNALSEYSPQTEALEPLTILLDDCGAIVGLGNWLRWLVLEQKPFPSQQRAFARLHRLTNRISCHGVA